MPADLAAAFHWVQKAALADDPNGWHSLAWFHEHGVGTAVDKSRAFELWLKAAGAGIPISQYSVGYCLAHGFGTEKNSTEALAWMELAFANGYDEPDAIALYNSVRQQLGPSPSSPSRFARRELDQGPVRTGSRWRYLVKVIFTTLRWWIERDDFSYHLRQSQSYEQGGWHRAAARHARAVLAIAEDAETRARLAYCCMQIGNIAESVREYRKAVTEWEHPAIMLGLAQAEFQNGNVETAQNLLEKVEGSYMAAPLLHAIPELKREMRGVT